MESCGRRGGGLGLADAQGVGQFQGIVEMDLNPVGARHCEVHVHKHFHIGGCVHFIFQADRDVFSLHQHFVAVRLEDPGLLDKLSFATAPAGDHAEAGVLQGEPGAPQGIKETDEDEFSIPLLADIITQQAGLKVREDVHGIHHTHVFHRMAG